MDISLPVYSTSVRTFLSLDGKESGPTRASKECIGVPVHIVDGEDPIPESARTKLWARGCSFFSITFLGGMIEYQQVVQ